MHKLTSHIFTVMTSLLLVCSCKEGIDESEYQSVVAQRDSVEEMSRKTQERLDNLTSYLQDISACVDSISAQEGILVASRDPETGRRYTRRELRERILAFSDLISRQRQRISELTDSLGNVEGSEEMARLTNMIQFLNNELAGKEAQMQTLQAELANSRRNVEELTQNVASLQTDNNQLQQENQTLDRTVSEQGDRMNECFFLALTERELKDKGIIKKNFLQKARFQLENVNLSECSRIDRRNFNDVRLDSRHPRILTQMPEGSYTFETSADGQSTLIIEDTARFWSMSNVLVIQL